MRIELRDYKELNVWRKAVELATDTYKLTKGFPETEKYRMTSQIGRAGTSVPANIAEGWGRGSTKEYIQHLTIARGSLLELETHLIVSRNLNYMSEGQFEEFEKPLQDIGKMLNRLIASLRSLR
jgi:four helix bundle protein